MKYLFSHKDEAKISEDSTDDLISQSPVSPYLLSYTIFSSIQRDNAFPFRGFPPWIEPLARFFLTNTVFRDILIQ
jgi:hypothetical protein